MIDYRARALALLKLVREWRLEAARAFEANDAAEARAGAAEQRAKKLADLLTLARLFVVSANFEAGYDGGSIRKQDLLPRIDAALSGDAAEGTVTK